MSFLEKLQEKNVLQVSTQESKSLLEKYIIVNEIKTGIAGPIQILQLDEKDNLIIESNQKGINYIRKINKKFVQEFVNERLSIYDKMWDGCGCKVFYDELWFSKNETAKELELK
jgi:hypothetical protein